MNLKCQNVPRTNCCPPKTLYTFTNSFSELELCKLDTCESRIFLCTVTLLSCRISTCKATQGLHFTVYIPTCKETHMLKYLILCTAYPPTSLFVLFFFFLVGSSSITIYVLCSFTVLQGWQGHLRVVALMEPELLLGHVEIKKG